MGDLTGEVRRLRSKADELFARVDGVANEVARDEMLRMARGYEQMADRMEDLAIKRGVDGS